MSATQLLRQLVQATQALPVRLASLIEHGNQFLKDSRAGQGDFGKQNVPMATLAPPPPVPPMPAGQQQTAGMGAPSVAHTDAPAMVGGMPWHLGHPQRGEADLYGATQGLLGAAVPFIPNPHLRGLAGWAVDRMGKMRHLADMAKNMRETLAAIKKRQSPDFDANQPDQSDISRQVDAAARDFPADWKAGAPNVPAPPGATQNGAGGRPPIARPAGSWTLPPQPPRPPQGNSNPAAGWTFDSPGPPSVPAAAPPQPPLMRSPNYKGGGPVVPSLPPTPEREIVGGLDDLRASLATRKATQPVMPPPQPVVSDGRRAELGSTGPEGQEDDVYRKLLEAATETNRQMAELTAALKESPKGGGGGGQSENGDSNTSRGRREPTEVDDSRKGSVIKQAWAQG